MHLPIQLLIFIFNILKRLAQTLLTLCIWLKKDSPKKLFSYGKQAVASRAKAAARAGELDDFGKAISVSESYVGTVIRAKRRELALARDASRKPSAEPPLNVWGIDMTGLPLTNGQSIAVFGILDHGSRVCLTATPVARYNSLILLGKLIQTMGEWGLPRAVRSDNDAVFKTKLFRWTLKLIGVQQQWTQIGSPWQNGRIERFWRTLKEGVLEKSASIKNGLIAIKTQFKFADANAMAQTLEQFQTLYNTQRPHQSLKGKTPAMAWETGKQKASQKQAARAPPWLRW